MQGGYHLVWARDLYEVATAFLAIGDRPAAERALNYLFETQQKPDGSFPQNSWLDGKPYWPSLQMDEVSYPLILAWQLGHTDALTGLGNRRQLIADLERLIDAGRPAALVDAHGA